ncbi:MAG: polyphosphate kinase 2 family protein [Flavobacteriales bacterium]|nr:polyphosphate kinase 2 family protein [Flavobacteriales bacterium]
MADLLHLPRFCIEEQGAVRLADHPTDLGDDLRKKELKASLEKDTERISELQEALYAQGRTAVLLIFQAMDAAGKDSCIRHVMTGVNPQGCRVWSFKAPTSEELAHDFLWRHAKAVPARGMIGIHNRSHYEEVLVVKVHPEYLIGQRLPGITSPGDADTAFWEQRYASIRAFEAHLARQGVVIMKFFLHMSKGVQKERFMERLDEPHKHWKFSAGDVKERAYWEAYQHAYEAALSATGSPHAPWFIVPADDQWESRAIVGRLVRERLEALDLGIAALTSKAQAELEEGRRLLEQEDRA